MPDNGFDKLTAGEIEKLTAGMAAGDARAVELFYRQYFDWLYRQTRRATRRDESFCLDVVQDAVLRIMRTIQSVDSQTQFHAWLRLVVQTTACDRLRSEKRRHKRELALASSRVSDVHVDHVSDASQYAWLKKRIERLDPQIARMIELRFEQRWTLARIGGLFGLSIGTIDGRLRRALRKLRDLTVEANDE